MRGNFLYVINTAYLITVSRHIAAGIMGMTCALLYSDSIYASLVFSVSFRIKRHVLHFNEVFLPKTITQLPAAPETGNTES